jgi:hypothetical protein
VLTDKQKVSYPELLSRRDVHDVTHEIVAVGSRSVEKAQEFIKAQIPGDESVKAYGTYTEVFQDKVFPAAHRPTFVPLSDLHLQGCRCCIYR